MFGNLFGKKKQPKTQCSICKSLLEYKEGFALTTSQVVVSKEYWDNKMVEPETMVYTTNHFKKKDENATKMRGIIFEKTAEKEHTWLTCDTCIKQFDVDIEQAVSFAEEWWKNSGQVDMPHTGKASDHLAPAAYDKMRTYAMMDAGASKIRL
ncbi:MAG: hypothetical protein O2887_14335 [Bacteroidetes bacterium]|nr:hypothetical protein [Bacteroidota bacterium]MDA1121648.1 hypothetical protein [Bacteroidota bacterium]